MNITNESIKFKQYLESRVKIERDSHYGSMLSCVLSEYNQTYDNIVKVEQERDKAILELAKGFSQVAKYSGVEAI